MAKLTRRTFLELAASFGAGLAWPASGARGAGVTWYERRELYPQGVASGDPHPDSVILWTRRPPTRESRAEKLNVEIAEDEAFRRVVATKEAKVGDETDWTCRVTAAGLRPARAYWYRFTDEHG